MEAGKKAQKLDVHERIMAKLDVAAEANAELNRASKPDVAKLKLDVYERFMARLDVAAEADAELNRASKPAVAKLKMLPELIHMLEKKPLQEQFLDRGVLCSLRTWFRPLPDGSLPNVNIRSALLKLLIDLRLDLKEVERREQLKKSRLGKEVMLLSRLPEETAMNRKRARDLVEQWSRPIFHNSTDYEDLRQSDNERILPRRMPVKKPRVEEARGGDELESKLDQARELRPGHPRCRSYVARPDPLSTHFVIRPASKVDAEKVRAWVKSREKKRSGMNTKLRRLRARNKSNPHAVRFSVEGRGLMLPF